MARIKSSMATPANDPKSANTNGTAESHEVLNLTEASEYLRVPSKEVLRMIGAEGLPGRKFGAEWRFLKSALQYWLSCTPVKEGLLSHLGKIKDGPYIEEMLKGIYERRGRSEAREE